MRRGKPNEGPARRVAGVEAPAFVERSWHGMGNRRVSTRRCVAGVEAPAFVEREVEYAGGHERPAECRRGGSPGLR